MKFKLNISALALLLALIALTLFPPISVMAQGSCVGQAALAPDGNGGYISGVLNPGDPGTACSVNPTGNRITINGGEYDEFTYTVTINGQTNAYTVYLPTTVTPTQASDGENSNRSGLLDITVDRPDIGIFYNPDPTCTSGYRCFWLQLSIVPITGVLVLSIITNVLAVILHKLDKYAERRNTVYAFLAGIAGAVLLTIFVYFDLHLAFPAVAGTVVAASLAVLYSNRFDGLTTETGYKNQVSLFKVWEAYRADRESVYKQDLFLGGKPTNPGEGGFMKMDEAIHAMQVLLGVKQKDEDGNDTKKPLFAGSVASIVPWPCTDKLDGALMYMKTKPGIDLTMILIILSTLLTGTLVIWGINVGTAVYGSVLTWLWWREYGRELTDGKKFVTNIRRVVGVALIMFAALAIIPHPIFAITAGLITAALLHQDWVKEGGFDLGNAISGLIISVTMWLILFFGDKASLFFNGQNFISNFMSAIF